MNNKLKRDLTTGSISKNLWFMALPMIGTHMIQTLFNLVDMIFVGKLGADAIAAVSVVGVFMMIPFSVIMGLGTATGAMVSRAYGAKDFERTNHVAMQALLSAIGGGLLLTILGYTLAPFIINIFGVSEQVHPIATQFLQIIFLASIPISIQFLSAAIFQAVGDAHTALWINLSGILLNVILDPILIFGLGPVPRLETAGAALATSIARAVGMGFAIYFLIKKKTHLHLHWEGIRVDWSVIKQIIVIGLPSGLQMTLRSATGIIMMGIVTGYGTFAVAAYGIGIRIDMLVLMPGFGLGAATAMLVGQNLGAQNPKRAEQTSWLASFYYAAFMLIGGILIYIFAKQIYHIFNNDPQVVSHGINYLHIVVFSYPIIAFGILLNRALSGAGVTFITMIITGTSLFGVGVPLALLIPKVTSLGIKGVWIAVMVGNIISSLWTFTVFIRGKWKNKKV